MGFRKSVKQSSKEGACVLLALIAANVVLAGSALGAVNGVRVFDWPGWQGRIVDMRLLDGGLWLAVMTDELAGQIWFSDGTESGTVFVKEVVPAPEAGGWPYYFLASYQVGNTVYFVADDQVHGKEVWKSQGTETSTGLLKDIHPTGDSYPGLMGDMNGILYFSASDDKHYDALWRTDGTEEGTSMLNAAHVASFAVIVGDILYFLADDGVHGKELWRTDGTEAGTYMVSDVNPGEGDGVSLIPVAMGNVLFFAGDDGVHGAELCRSNGTEAGTELVLDIAAGTPGSSPVRLTSLSSRLFFFADDGVHGRELWISDGSSDGTTMVEDICSGATGSDATSAMAFGDAVYFIANDGVHGRELWKSDGSAEGTDIVVDFAPDFAGVPFPVIKTVFGEYLYFCRYIYDAINITYCEFYRTDGTATGTSLIGTYTDDAQGPPLEWIASYGDVVYYGSIGRVYRLTDTSPELVEMHDSALGMEAAASAEPLPILWADRLYMQSKEGDLWSISAFGGEGEGTLHVSIEPAEVLALGAQWSVDGGEWHESGETVTLAVGQHTVSFKDIEGDSSGCFRQATAWNTPGDQIVTIVAGQTTERTGTYISSKKSLSAGIPDSGSKGNILTAAILVASLAHAGRRIKKSHR